LGVVVLHFRRLYRYTYANVAEMALSIHAQWKIEIVSYVVNGTVFFVINIVFKSNKSLLSVLFFSLIVVAFTGKGGATLGKIGYGGSDRNTPDSLESTFFHRHLI
jgi:hypothetical protein